MPLVFQYADLELIFLSSCPNNGVHRRQYDSIFYNIGYNLKNLNEPGKVRFDAQNILKLPFGTFCVGGMVFLYGL